MLESKSVYLCSGSTVVLYCKDTGRGAVGCRLKCVSPAEGGSPGHFLKYDIQYSAGEHKRGDMKGSDEKALLVT